MSPVALLIASLAVQCGSRPAGTAAPPSNFVYFGRDHERVLDPSFYAHPRIAGAQLTFTWRELEPYRDRYDFEPIRKQLTFLQGHGKSLFLQISDVTFSERPPVPDYLLSDSTFHGGAARKLEGAAGTFDGRVARRWDPAVRERFALLLEALAGEFDGRIEGVNLPETAIGFESPKFHPPGFTFDAYAAGVLEILKDARRAFDQSCVIIYANFMPGESLPSVDHGYLKSIYELAERIGAGVGGPDLLPFREGQQANSLPLITNRGPGVIAGVAVQDGNLADVDPTTGRPVTVEALYRYATDTLRLDYIFWGAEEPFFSRDVLPYLRADSLLEAQEEADDPDQEAWIDLFDGETLDGWTVKLSHLEVGDDYANTFRTEDGRIEVRYDGYEEFGERFGHLYYDQAFSFYRLAFEYRFVGDFMPDAPDYARLNSGVMFHSQDPRTMPVDQDWPISVEFQLLAEEEPGQPRPTGNMCSPGTAVVYDGELDERHCIESRAGTYPKDRWVSAELLVLGDSLVRHVIEGEPVMEYTHPQIGGGVVSGYDPAQKVDGKPLTEGFIALQAEGQEIDFRHVRLLNLKGCTDPEALNYKRYHVASDAAACRY